MRTFGTNRARLEGSAAFSVAGPLLTQGFLTRELRIMLKVRSIVGATIVLVSIAGLAPLEARQAPRTVTLTVTDPVGEKMSYSLKQITAKPGEKIKVRLVSMAQTPKIVMAHNFVLLKDGTNLKAYTDAAANARATDYIPAAFKSSILAQTGMVGPGESM